MGKNPWLIVIFNFLGAVELSQRTTNFCNCLKRDRKETCESESLGIKRLFHLRNRTQSSENLDLINHWSSVNKTDMQSRSMSIFIPKIALILHWQLSIFFKQTGRCDVVAYSDVDARKWHLQAWKVHLVLWFREERTNRWRKRFEGKEAYAFLASETTKSNSE